MNSALLVLIGLIAMFFGYRFYSKFLAEKIFRLDPTFKTPANTMRDDIDYVPANKVMLWGNHFTAVAGAGPIIGPAIGVMWGWVPAFLWVVLGTMFFAGVHDFGSIWASVRNRAVSMGAMTGDLVSPRARLLFMIVIFLLLLTVNAVFAVAIADAYIATPTSVIPTWSAIVVAVVIGLLIYRGGSGILWPTVVGTIVLYAVIYVGELVPVTLPDRLVGLPPSAQWILILFVYCTIASMAPMWLVLQPRGYINGVQLFVGLGLVYAAMAIAQPTIVAPAFNTNVPANAPPMVPLLFVTIACGAISGFHGLVGSGTTSKQLDREPDARFVGYLGSFGEGSLALVSIIAATAGIAATQADWHALYSTFAVPGMTIFSRGGANILTSGLGLSSGFAETLLAVMAVLFASTTMDSSVRLQRYIVQEWGVIYGIPVFQNMYIATAISVIACLALAFGAGGIEGTGGMIIWPLFGSANQLLAGLTLLVITVMLVRFSRPYLYTFIPMVFVTSMSLLASLYQVVDLYRTGQYLLLVVDIVIVVAAIFVILEASAAFLRERRSSATRVAQPVPELERHL